VKVKVPLLLKASISYPHAMSLLYAISNPQLEYRYRKGSVTEFNIVKVSVSQLVYFTISTIFMYFVVFVFCCIWLLFYYYYHIKLYLHLPLLLSYSALSYMFVH